MSDIDRKRAIEELKREYCGDSVIMRKAKDFAVASLEADEAYQLEFERTAKNDVSDINVGKIEPTTKNNLVVDCKINDLDDFIEFAKKTFGVELTIKKSDNPDTYEKLFGTTKNDLGVREFEEIVVEYPPEDLCTYPEYKGKPYFGIKYKENEKEIVGYGTYKPEVLSQYLKDYFISTTKDYLGVDCISRRAVIEEMEKRHTEGDYITKGFINSLPSVTPQEPKTGHWITTRTFMHDGEYYCDKCKCESPNNEKWNYCPNCGADMREVEE